MAATAMATVDEKREEFRQYLERAGVMDALTRAMVALYEEREKPENPVEYIRKYIGDRRPTAAEMQQIQDSVQESEAAVAGARDENDVLRGRLTELDPESELLATPRPGDEPEEGAEAPEEEEPAEGERDPDEAPVE